MISCILPRCDRNTLAFAPAERGHYWSPPSATSPLPSIIILLQSAPLHAPAAQLAGRLAFLPASLLKDARRSPISRCTAKDPPLLTPAFSNISWFNPRAVEGGSGTARLQWLVGLLRWSRAGYQSAMTRKQTGQKKQRNVGELILHLYPVYQCQHQGPIKFVLLDFQIHHFFSSKIRCNFFSKFLFLGFHLLEFFLFKPFWLKKIDSESCYSAHKDGRTRLCISVNILNGFTRFSALTFHV